LIFKNNSGTILVDIHSICQLFPYSLFYLLIILIFATIITIQPGGQPMKNNKWIISLAAVLMMVSSFAFGQEKLDPIVAYSLKKIPIALGKAEDLTNKGDLPNAKVYLKSAQKEWDRINKNFKERFDPTHPDIVGAREQLKNVKEKVEEADQKKKP